MAQSLDGAALDRIEGQANSTRPLRALVARLAAALARRRTRRILRRLDAERLADIGLAPGSPQRSRWL